MQGEKIYLQPMSTVLGAINDLVELQKGKLTFSDTPHGRIHFVIKMYAHKWELQFAVTDIGRNRSQVRLEIGGEKQDKEDFIRRELALLDSMLISEARIEIGEKEAGK